MESLIVVNKIIQRIKEFEVKGFKFVPGRIFYQEIGIGQKRWGQLTRNEKSITIEELNKISRYFQIPFDKLVEFPKITKPNYQANIN